MKILTLHQCPDCKGVGVCNDFSLNKQSSPSIQYPMICAKCNGEKVVEEWMDAGDFIRTHINGNIKPE